MCKDVCGLVLYCEQLVMKKLMSSPLQHCTFWLLLYPYSVFQVLDNNAVAFLVAADNKLERSELSHLRICNFGCTHIVFFSGKPQLLKLFFKDFLLPLPQLP